MLDRIQIRVAPLSNQIVLARFGKSPNVALETREVMNEFLQALTSYAFDGQLPAPGQGVELQYGGGDEQFVMTIRRKAEGAERAPAEAKPDEVAIAKKARELCFAVCSAGGHLDFENGCCSVCQKEADCQGWRAYHYNARLALAGLDAAKAEG
jgi:hypothetical protein